MNMTNQEFIQRAIDHHREHLALYEHGFISADHGVQLTAEKFTEMFPTGTPIVCEEIRDDRPRKRISTVVEGIEFFALFFEDNGRIADES